VSRDDISWADIINLTENSHLSRLHRKFPEALQGKRTITLLIPDECQFILSPAFEIHHEGSSLFSVGEFCTYRNAVASYSPWLALARRVPTMGISRNRVNPEVGYIKECA